MYRYLEPFRRDSRVWQTDGQTEPLLAIARYNDPRWKYLLVASCHADLTTTIFSVVSMCTCNGDCRLQGVIVHASICRVVGTADRLLFPLMLSLLLGKPAPCVTPVNSSKSGGYVAGCLHLTTPVSSPWVVSPSSLYSSSLSTSFYESFTVHSRATVF